MTRPHDRYHGEPTQQPTLPTAPSQRQALPDQLRGISLLGIALVNTPFLAISVDGYTSAATGTLLDRITAFVVVAFAQGKFYLLFSFLFGYGLTLLLKRPGVEGMRRYRRRLVGLGALGVLHGVLFFLGDILLSYAVLGFVLIWFVQRSDRTALRAATMSYLAAVAVLALLVLAVIANPNAAGSGAIAGAVSFDDAMLGSFTTSAVARAEALPGAIVFLAVFNWLQILAMFLLGLVAGRRQLLAEPERHRRLWWRLLIVAGVVGVPIGVAAGLLAHGPGTPTDLRGVLSATLAFAGAPALTGGYIAAIALLTRQRWLRVLEPAGRMSLTGYLGESILMSAIFCGWGLGWFGRHGAFAATLIGIAVWAALDLFAHLWLSRYRYGPFEWLLRAWSYRTLPPMRRE